jgi:hypothetical protein
MNRSIIRWVMLGAVILTFSVASFGQIAVGVSVRVGPPPLPVYAQPICPGPGYIWTPGYWAWDDDDGYYWVPGTWVVAPIGMLWTPGYWGWGGGFYAWHAGYWGPHVGFYGGINYGFGYGGVGFVGGEWRHGAFYYNRSVTNVSITNVTHVYNRTVVRNTSTTSFNGGRGGLQARASRQEEEYGRERHTAPLDVQRQHERAAVGNRENLASQNHGRPAIAATARPGDFSRRAAVPARAAGGEYHPPAMSPKQARVNPGAVNRGNSNRMNAGNNGNNNRTRSNDEFRPFTPPAKNNAGNGRTGENYNHNQGGNNSRGNPNRSNESRTPQQHEMAPPRQAPHQAPQRSSPPPHSSPAPQHHAPPPGPHHGKGF